MRLYFLGLLWFFDFKTEEGGVNIFIAAIYIYDIIGLADFVTVCSGSVQ